MQVVLRHIQVRMTDHALDRRQVDPQRLHLADIGVAAGMRRQLTHILDGSHILLELVPVVLGVEGLLSVRRLEDRVDSQQSRRARDSIAHPAAASFNLRVMIFEFFLSTLGFV